MGPEQNTKAEYDHKLFNTRINMLILECYLENEQLKDRSRFDIAWKDIYNGRASKQTRFQNYKIGKYTNKLIRFIYDTALENDSEKYYSGQKRFKIDGIEKKIESEIITFDTLEKLCQENKDSKILTTDLIRDEFDKAYNIYQKSKYINDVYLSKFLYVLKNYSLKGFSGISYYINQLNQITYDEITNATDYDLTKFIEILETNLKMASSFQYLKDYMPVYRNDKNAKKDLP